MNLLRRNIDYPRPAAAKALAATSVFNVTSGKHSTWRLRVTAVWQRGCRPRRLAGRRTGFASRLRERWPGSFPQDSRSGLRPAAILTARPTLWADPRFQHLSANHQCDVFKVGFFKPLYSVAPPTPTVVCPSPCASHLYVESRSLLWSKFDKAAIVFPCMACSWRSAAVVRLMLWSGSALLDLIS
ncbi:hypothetical protein E2C01_074598 [Portunus trituberculatus]|uniref:Uncharacterized protein n=1 Tax=Portunus trituberculatus TaxID=210409 RepID=A0A5B7ICW7_PORTR|nr:hypothetical protein [Portunus trituberculatus]